MGVKDFLSSFYVEELIVRAVRKSMIRSDDEIHVGEVSGCLRKAFYQRLYPKSFVGASAVKVFLGECIHRGVQEAVREFISASGDVAEAEMDVRRRVCVDGDEFFIVGHPDIYLEGDDGRVVIEIKTTGSIPEKPYEEHKRQLLYYLTLTEADLGAVLYISRDGLLKSFIVTNSEGVWDELVERAHTLYRALKYRRPPPSERNRLCKYCPYKFRCFGGGV